MGKPKKKYYNRCDIVENLWFDNRFVIFIDVDDFDFIFYMIY